MQIPTVWIVGGPRGRLLINEEDLPEWREKGYRLEGEDPPAPPKKKGRVRRATEKEIEAIRRKGACAERPRKRSKR
jgi:hypothetical protein